jgi:shikimate kinase
MNSVLFFIGYMGAGKTYTVQRMAARCGKGFVDLDAAIEEEERATIPDLFRERGEEAFRIIEQQVLHRLVENEHVQLVACGGGTPCIAGMMNWMKSHGHVVHLNPSFDLIKKRLFEADKMHMRPLLLNPDGMLKTIEQIEQHWESRNACYSGADEVLASVPTEQDFRRWNGRLI